MQSVIDNKIANIDLLKANAKEQKEKLDETKKENLKLTRELLGAMKTARDLSEEQRKYVMGQVLVQEKHQEEVKKLKGKVQYLEDRVKKGKEDAEGNKKSH